jgi:hypothetical protein
VQLIRSWTPGDVTVGGAAPIHFFSKLSIMENEEKDFLEDTDIDVKPKKKQLSEQKIQHLQNTRVKH